MKYFVLKLEANGSEVSMSISNYCETIGTLALRLKRDWPVVHTYTCMKVCAKK